MNGTTATGGRHAAAVDDAPLNDAPLNDAPEGTVDVLTGGAVDTTSGADWLARYTGSLMGVFGTPQRVLVRGSGCHVWDADGQQYLDLLGGIAVNALGHAHPFVTSVVTSQLATLGHISNFFTSPTQVALAEKLLHLAKAPTGSRVFFTNSGAEALEAAVKLARRNSTPERTRILALDGAFHGRTMGALALTSKKAYRQPFEPLPGGVEHIAFDDVEALAAAMDHTVAALVIEPIQGEAGVRPLSPEYLRAARDLTREHGALLILDEVQSGIGRTGRWFAHQWVDGVVPDAMTLAKGLGGGFPVGALVTFGEHVSTLISAGQHGTTFGGNPVATAAGLATLHALEASNSLDNAFDVGRFLRDGLTRTEGVTAVRGEGLLIGFDLDGEHAPAAVQAALTAGFIINATGPGTIRLAPPLILTREQAATFLDALPGILTTARSSATEAPA